MKRGVFIVTFCQDNEDSKVAEQKIQNFLESSPQAMITHILQSSAGAYRYGIRTTITIFYTLP